MTHLTATAAATAPGRCSTSSRLRPKYPVSSVSSRGGSCLLSPVDAEMIFCSVVANFLELPRADSHYSVIDSQGAQALALGHGGRHLLKGEVQALKSRGDTADARIRADEK